MYLNRESACLGRYQARFCSLLEHHSYRLEDLQTAGNLDYLRPEVRRGDRILEGLGIETIVDASLEYVNDRSKVDVDQSVQCA